MADKVCPKCAGTGKFALYVMDGRLVSNTGTTCWRCHGTGKVQTGTKKDKAHTPAAYNRTTIERDEHGVYRGTAYLNDEVVFSCESMDWNTICAALREYGK